MGAQLNTGGHRLRALREALGFTMREVAAASTQIAGRLGSEDFFIPPSRLSDIETKGVVPSVFRFYSLAAIYHRPVRALLQLYGIDLDGISSEWDSSQPAHTHLVTLENEQTACSIPVKMDPGFDLRETSDLGRMVQ